MGVRVYETDEDTVGGSGTGFNAGCSVPANDEVGTVGLLIIGGEFAVGGGKTGQPQFTDQSITWMLNYMLGQGSSIWLSQDFLDEFGIDTTIYNAPYDAQMFAA